MTLLVYRQNRTHFPNIYCTIFYGVPVNPGDLWPWQIFVM